MISMQTLVAITYFVQISKTLMFPCCFVDDSLMILWRDIFEALLISMETFLIFFVFVVLVVYKLEYDAKCRGRNVQNLGCWYNLSTRFSTERNRTNTEIWLAHEGNRLLKPCLFRIFARSFNMGFEKKWFLLDFCVCVLFYFFS